MKPIEASKKGDENKVKEEENKEYMGRGGGNENLGNRNPWKTLKVDRSG